MTAIRRWYRSCFCERSEAASLAVTAVAVSAAALSAFAAALGTRVLQVAPSSTDLAAAGSSTAFNVGITMGALLGSGLLTTTGLRSVAIAGFAVAVLALVAQLLEGRKGFGPHPTLDIAPEEQRTPAMTASPGS